MWHFLIKHTRISAANHETLTLSGIKLTVTLRSFREGFASYRALVSNIKINQPKLFLSTMCLTHYQLWPWTLNILLQGCAGLWWLYEFVLQTCMGFGLLEWNFRVDLFFSSSIHGQDLKQVGFLVSGLVLCVVVELAVLVLGGSPLPVGT